jgi:hypothetical protein
MRKIALAAGIAGLLLSPSSTAVAGGKPSRVPIPASDNAFDDPAGMDCSFELAGQPVANNEKVTTFPAQANGDVVQIVTGTVKYELTNVDTGKSIMVNTSGPGHITIYPDGSETAVLSGRSLFTFLPTDIPAGPATYLTTGRVVVNETASGQSILVSESGTREDICAALS